MTFKEVLERVKQATKPTIAEYVLDTIVENIQRIILVNNVIDKIETERKKHPTYKYTNQVIKKYEKTLRRLANV